jgi:type II secretory pathway component PulF
MVVAIGIVIFMLTYIVPKFVDVYASMGSEINAITQICLDLSAFLKTKYTYLLLGILVLVLGFRYSYKYIKSFRTFSLIYEIC